MDHYICMCVYIYIHIYIYIDVYITFEELGTALRRSGAAYGWEALRYPPHHLHGYGSLPSLWCDLEWERSSSSLWGEVGEVRWRGKPNRGAERGARTVTALMSLWTGVQNQCILPVLACWGALARVTRPHAFRVAPPRDRPYASRRGARNGTIPGGRERGALLASHSIIYIYIFP